MGTFGGAQPIVTDGLVFAVDAANYQSYPGSGTTWTDLAGNNNGTLANGPTFDSGNGGSIVFDGTDDYIGFGDILNIEPTGDFTWQVWCYPEEKTSRYRTILGKGYASSTGFQLRMDRSLPSNDNKFIFESNHTTSGRASVSTETVDNNTWYLVTCIIEGNQRKLYLNTTLKNQNTFVGDFIYGPSNLYVGDNRAASEYWLGKINYITHYHKALSPSEISQNYNALKGRFGL